MTGSYKNPMTSNAYIQFTILQLSAHTCKIDFWPSYFSYNTPYYFIDVWLTLKPHRLIKVYVRTQTNPRCFKLQNKAKNKRNSLCYLNNT
ncbi:hypothetical protein AQUCO_04300027v1 [Aquilegia coerulea]|uniref:Uncharacterized protein n=1 Tax=Aquilegia coerulea TaxID=218851 RepID=A0A2G5CNE1_AQUCA|nr:hypothetical protein AQUCO_04300027v1 [Aquilegia coerulea]